MCVCVLEKEEDREMGREEGMDLDMKRSGEDWGGKTITRIYCLKTSNFNERKIKWA